MEGEASRQNVLALVFPRANFLRHALAAEFYDLQVLCVDPHSSLEVALVLLFFFRLDVEHIGVEVVHALLAGVGHIVLRKVFGGEDQRQSRTHLQKLAPDIEPAHQGHGEVGNDGLEVARGETLDGALGVRLDHRLVAEPRERALAEFSEDQFVIEKQDALTVAIRNRVRLVGHDCRLRFKRGEVEVDVRAFARLAVDRDRTVVRTHDAVDDRESESCAGADRLRREKRIEDATEGGGAHAAAGIADRDARVTTRPELTRRCGEIVRDRERIDFDFDRASRGADRVRGIGHDVHDDLHDLGSVPASAFDVIQMNPLYTSANVPTGASPTINSFTPSASSVSAGTQVTLSWDASNADYYVISPALGAVRGTSAIVTPTQTTTYTLYATNQYGRTKSTVTVTVQ